MTKKVQSYIADGYTELGYVKASENLWPELRFSYRPMLKADRAILFGAEASSLPEDEQAQHAANAMASHLVDWELKDANGDDVKVTASNILRVKQFDQLFSIITGLRPSDVDPRWDDDRKATTIGDKLNEKFNPTEDDAKN